MVFSTHIFIFYFLPLVLLLYYLLTWMAHLRGASPRAVSLIQNSWLLVASYVFYGWWNPWFILLMLTVTVVHYVAGVMVGRAQEHSPLRFRATAVAVAFSLCMLGFFKYGGFFQINLNHVLHGLGAGELRVLQIALPIGISFYVFHAISYSVDIYRRTTPPAHSFVDFACYIALYPQLVAGPIVRYNSVAGQLVRREHGWEPFSAGVALFVMGLGKKVLLANPVGAVADIAFSAPAPAAVDAWYGVIAYAFQIYFDFSSYSDMALGLGRMIGFEFPRNFDDPYHADSITDFWRRWHISLSTFLRDYLYIPLGGNRKGSRRTYINLAIVMLLGGLWHGANWTFILWGAYHGGLLGCERVIGKQPIYRGIPRPLRIAITFVLILFSWVLFRSPNVHEAGRYFAAMFGRVGHDASTILLAGPLYAQGSLLVMLACALLLLTRLQAHEWSARITWPKALILGPAFCFIVLIMFAQSFSPFLYFQF